MISFTPTGGDDTLALQAAVAADSVTIQPGTSLLSDTVHVPGNRLLEWAPGAEVLADHPTCHLFSADAANIKFSAPRIGANVARTYGAYIKMQATAVRVVVADDWYMEGGYRAIECDSTIVSIRDGEIRDTPTGGIGMVFNQGFRQSVARVTADSQHSPAAGIWVNATGDLMLDDVGLMRHGYALALCPGAGQVVGNVRASLCQFDSSIIGILVNPALGGHVIYMRASNSWCSGHTYNAALVAGAGQVGAGGIYFDGVDFDLSGTNGVRVTNASAKAAQNVKAAGSPTAVVTYV